MVIAQNASDKANHYLFLFLSIFQYHFWSFFLSAPTVTTCLLFLNAKHRLSKCIARREYDFLFFASFFYQAAESDSSNFAFAIPRSYDVVGGTRIPEVRVLIGLPRNLRVIYAGVNAKYSKSRARAESSHGLLCKSLQSSRLSGRFLNGSVAMDAPT